MLKFFAVKMWVAFAVQKLLTFFQQKISEYCILNLLKQLKKSYPVVCVNVAEELFCKTRSTSRSISTLLGVVIMQRSSSTGQGVPVGVYLTCCVYKYCRGALLHDRELQQEYIYPVIYKTRSTSSICILLCLLILQRSSSRRQGAPVGVYLPCCVC